MINAPVQTRTPVLGKVYTEEEIGLMTSSQLVSIYNNIAEITETFKEVKKFSDNPTAVKRTWAALLGYDTWWDTENEDAATTAPDADADTPAADAPPVPDAPAPTVPAPELKALAVPRKSTAVNFLGMRTDIAPSAEIVPVQKGTSIRAQALALLTSEAGATEEQLTGLFAEADAKRGRTAINYLPRTYQMVRIFCHHYGYGTLSSADGKVVRLITTRVKA